MDEKHDRSGMISPPTDELKGLLERAAETGARRALREVGLDNGEAREDIRELRSLLAGLRLAKRTAFQTAVRIITAGILPALMTGLVIKLRLFGGAS